MSLSSEQLVLREIKIDDWRSVHSYASQAKVSRFQPWGPNTEEDSKLFVEQAIKDAENNPRTRFVFAIIHKEDGKMIGVVELNIRDISNKSGEIAYIVHPDYWGKGIATEAGSLLIEYGFGKRGLHRIYATCDPRNTGSSRVLEKIGMSREGRMQQHLLIKDGWRDSYLYSVLENELQKGC
nr:GNAT family protein [Sediminibacillus massiliensis]